MKGSEFKFPMGIGSGKDSLGLIIVDRMAGACGKEHLYSFLHLTFQEYLAAYHVAKLSEEDQMKINRLVWQRIVNASIVEVLLWDSKII